MKNKYKNKFRCSCCNKVKSDSEIIYKKWSINDSTKVGVCFDCDFLMSYLKIKFAYTLNQIFCFLK